MMNDNPLNLGMTMIKNTSKIIMSAMVAGICFMGCKKSGSDLKPVLRFKSVNSYEVHPNQLLSVTLESENTSDLKTKESDTALAVQFIVINRASCIGGTNDKTFFYRTALPASGAYTGTSEIVLNWVVGSNGVGLPAGYGGLPPVNCRPVDSCIIRFWVKNTANKTSDTVTIDKPIAIYH